jgi:hypothetical protein
MQSQRLLGQEYLYQYHCKYLPGNKSMTKSQFMKTMLAGLMMVAVSGCTFFQHPNLIFQLFDPLF